MLHYKTKLIVTSYNQHIIRIRPQKKNMAFIHSFILHQENYLKFNFIQKIFCLNP